MGKNDKKTEKGDEKSHLISIIVPVYNVMEYLPRCVASLRNQTYPELEILLVDDGSTDGTGELCDRLGEEDPRIRVFHKKNGGTSTARNLGIREAKGEYLGFVDSDDYVDADMYERLEGAIRKYGFRAAQVGRDELDAEGKALPDICVPPQEVGIIGEKDFLRELLMHRGDCSFCTKLIRRDCFRGLEFPEGKLNEDFRLLVEMLPVMGPLVSLPGHAYHVCYRLGSNTRKENRETFSRVYWDCVENADLVLELVKGRYLEGNAQSAGSAPGQWNESTAERSNESTLKWSEEKGNAPELPEERAAGWPNESTLKWSEAEEALREQTWKDLETAAYRFGVFQRLEYLLHIPISQMTRENGQYRQVVRWLRRHLWKALRNPYLTVKNKVYHVLFAAVPRGVRKAHAQIRRL